MCFSGGEQYARRGDRIDNVLDPFRLPQGSAEGGDGPAALALGRAASRPGQGSRGGARAEPARQVPVRQRAVGVGRGRGRSHRGCGSPRHQRPGDGLDDGEDRPDRGHVPGGLDARPATRARARRRGGALPADGRRSHGCAVASAGAAPAVRALAGAARVDHPRGDASRRRQQRCRAHRRERLPAALGLRTRRADRAEERAGRPGRLDGALLRRTHTVGGPRPRGTGRSGGE